MNYQLLKFVSGLLSQLEKHPHSSENFKNAVREMQSAVTKLMRFY